MQLSSFSAVGWFYESFALKNTNNNNNNNNQTNYNLPTTKTLQQEVVLTYLVTHSLWSASKLSNAVQNTPYYGRT